MPLSYSQSSSAAQRAAQNTAGGSVNAPYVLDFSSGSSSPLSLSALIDPFAQSSSSGSPSQGTLITDLAAGQTAQAATAAAAASGSNSTIMIVAVAAAALIGVIYAVSR